MRGDGHANPRLCTCYAACAPVEQTDFCRGSSEKTPMSTTPSAHERKVIRHREVDRTRRRPRQRGPDSILPTSIRQGNSPRSKVTRRIWSASRCGPPSHRKVRDVCWMFLCLPEVVPQRATCHVIGEFELAGMANGAFPSAVLGPGHPISYSE